MRSAPTLAVLGSLTLNSIWYLLTIVGSMKWSSERVISAYQMSILQHCTLVSRRVQWTSLWVKLWLTNILMLVKTIGIIWKRKAEWNSETQCQLRSYCDLKNVRNGYISHFRIQKDSQLTCKLLILEVWKFKTILYFVSNKPLFNFSTFKLRSIVGRKEVNFLLHDNFRIVIS